jgi:homoaconitate hydratase
MRQTDMRQTIVEKIAQRHMTAGPDRPLRAGDVVSLRPAHVLTHDNSSAVMKKFLTLGAADVFDPSQPVFALDHDIQNTSADNLAKYGAIEAFARERGIDFHPAGMGIGHQIMIERGYVVPGSLVVASDSHANMYGAMGAMGTPVVRTDAAAIWATGEFWWAIPPTVHVVLEGELAHGVSGKDVIITLCGLYNQGEVLNAAVEFGGPGVASLDMAARLSIANMTTEWGALVGWFPVDEVTLAYLRARQERLGDASRERIPDTDVAAWTAAPPAPDPDADYAARITLDLGSVRPRVSGPDSVQVMRSVEDIEAEGVAIQKAYLVSCANSRHQDLEDAAAVLAGRKVAGGVELYVAAASREEQMAAEASGAWGTLVEAGAIPLPPGCGPCIGLGEGLLEAGEVGISATNRNFKGRMGSPDGKVYLASPRVVAASAVAGRIVAPEEPGAALAGGPHEPGPAYRRDVLPAPMPPREIVDILPGFPAALRGRLVYVPADNLNTDGIYGKDYTYRELTRDEMARVVMANYDPGFAGRIRPGDVLVGGRNFGTGSSREQAATALQARGIALVLAASFSQTYRRNAFNNGLLCIECPGLVERLQSELAPAGGTDGRTLILGDDLAVDFVRSTVTWRGEAFPFPPLGRVPQELIAAGGIEPLLGRHIRQTQHQGA